MFQGFTFVLGDELMTKLRNIQAERIRNSKAFVSFSSLLNEIVEDGLNKK